MTDGQTERLHAALGGAYRIERKLGDGGMASVYLAHDVKHERRVAIKVLRPELAAMIGAERFLAEIKTTANLQHPHILPLFDSGEADGFLYYVMPYIDGETLRERVEREQQLAVEAAVRIARDVADALDYAHRAGIIHRDIKPANILLHDGRPIVADFGIALALSAAGGGRMTETGLSLGTPHYMSPEQASADRDLSARSDIYSLGCVLYEMLAGQPPHTGPSAQSILVRILTEDARDVSDLRRTVAPNVAAAVMKSIEKLPADRFDSAKAFMAALDDEAFRFTTSTGTPAARAGRAPVGGGRRRVSARGVLIPALAASTVLMTGLAAWGWLRPTAPAPVTRVDVALGDPILPGTKVVVSPDGNWLAFTGALDGVPMLRVRRIDESAFRVLPGTEDAGFPDFSPESDWIVYRDMTEDALEKISLAGGQPLTVLDHPDVSPWFPHWAEGGVILFTSPQGQGLQRVPAAGGSPTRLGVDWGNHPRLLPGGWGVTFTEDNIVRLLDLTSGETRDLVAEGLDATYLPTGHLLYSHPAGGLHVVPFDLERMEVTGDPTPVVDDVGNDLGGGHYSVSQTGTLVYVTGRGAWALNEIATSNVLTELDLATGELTPTPLPPSDYQWPRYAPDGTLLAFAAGDPTQIFVYDLSLAVTPRQLTFGHEHWAPAWSPDGTRLAYQARREGDADRLAVKALDDSPEVYLPDIPMSAWPLDWHDDRLVFASTASGAPDLWIADAAGASAPEAYLEADAPLGDATISPDGTLLAYRAREGAEGVLYVRSFPTPRQQSRVSPGGGRTPRWAPNGDAIYFWNWSGADTLYKANVRREPSFAVLSIEVVLTGGFWARDWWDLHPDGTRAMLIDDSGQFVNPAARETEAERHIVVFNWFEELKARLGGGE